MDFVSYLKCGSRSLPFLTLVRICYLLGQFQLHFLHRTPCFRLTAEPQFLLLGYFLIAGLNCTGTSSVPQKVKVHTSTLVPGITPDLNQMLRPLRIDT